MSSDRRPIDRTLERPLPEEHGIGNETGSVWLGRILTRLMLGKSPSREECNGSKPSRVIDSGPEKPPPEESGMWNKQGFKTVDRIVNWLFADDSDMP